MERSYEKRITLDSQILRHMRISRSLSLNQAGRLIGISGSAIAHIEQGRMDVSKARVRTMVEAYSYNMDDYFEYYDGKQVPTNLRDECIILLKRCDESKVKMLHPVIINLAK